MHSIRCDAEASDVSTFEDMGVLSAPRRSWAAWFDRRACVVPVARNILSQGGGFRVGAVGFGALQGAAVLCSRSLHRTRASTGRSDEILHVPVLL